VVQLVVLVVKRITV